MSQPLRQRLRTILGGRFSRFVLTGGFAAGVNLGSRYLLSEVMSFRSAVALAYLCGMITAWVLARAMVFEATGRSWSQELLRFGLVNIFSAAQVWLVSVALAEWAFPHLHYAFHPEMTAHAIGVVIPVFTSYAGHKYFTFADHKPDASNRAKADFSKQAVEK